MRCAQTRKGLFQKSCPLFLIQDYSAIHTRCFSVLDCARVDIRQILGDDMRRCTCAHSEINPQYSVLTLLPSRIL